MEAFAVPDQTADTIARLLVEKIVCVHGVPEQLLSDRGAISLYFVGYYQNQHLRVHPQTDGLVEKLINMIAKSTNKSYDWDDLLPYLSLVAGVE